MRKYTLEYVRGEGGVFKGPLAQRGASLADHVAEMQEILAVDPNAKIEADREFDYLAVVWERALTEEEAAIDKAERDARAAAHRVKELKEFQRLKAIFEP